MYVLYRHLHLLIGRHPSCTLLRTPNSSPKCPGKPTFLSREANISPKPQQTTISMLRTIHKTQYQNIPHILFMIINTLKKIQKSSTQHNQEKEQFSSAKHILSMYVLGRLKVFLYRLFY